MMFQVPFLCIAASCLLGHTIAERPLSTEGGVSVRATGGFQTAKRHIPESQVEASSLSETAEVEKSSPSKTAESTEDVQVDKSSLSETAESALGMQQIIRQQLSIMQQQLDILNLQDAKRGASGGHVDPLAGQPGAAALGSSGWKIPEGDRNKFNVAPADGDSLTVEGKAETYGDVKEKKLTHLKGEKPHDVADLSMTAQKFDKATGTLTDEALPVTDSYENLRKEMLNKEELIFAKTFDTKAYNDAGSTSHESNKAYKDKLAQYVQKLFMMSRGAHQVTAKEFNEHLAMASELSKAVHTGYNDIAVGDKDTFASELNTAKGHVSKEGREKMLAYSNDIVRTADGSANSLQFDRDHIAGLNHGTAAERAQQAADQASDRHGR